ncbi:MAG: glycerol-3-phosphate 1-O-acyltransferase PlsY [Planctomycetota bacterium]
MDGIWQLMVFVAAGFAAGSVPFALLLGLARGVDIRTVGSKNVGATNLGRTLGLNWFFAAFVLDAIKGFVPPFVYALVIGHVGWDALNLPAAAAAAWLAVVIAPVLGHMFSPFVGFKGGKGVATGLGAVLGVWPVLTVPGVGALVVFLVVFLVWRYVSLASIVAASSLPLWTWYFFSTVSRLFADPGDPSVPVGMGLDGDRTVALAVRPWVFVGAATLIAVAVILKHKGNLRRLADGTEPKAGGSKAS